jgi:iron complex transport system ATP-binding protein
MLAVENITVRFGPCDVLAGISFTLSEGEMVVLVGPNGSGKTTLIKALNGTLPAVAGSVKLDGRPLAEYSRRDLARRVAVVAQENETKFPVTVLDFVLAGRFASGSAFGWEGPDDIAIAEKALAECGLDRFGTRLMNELSGGERQRVVMARAVAAGSEILLLDEPTANLDLTHQAMMFSLVRGRCKGLGHSAVVITHDLNLAAEFADRILMLGQGRIVAAGTASEVLNAKNITDVFGVNALLDTNPASGKVRVTPIFG